MSQAEHDTYAPSDEIISLVQRFIDKGGVQQLMLDVRSPLCSERPGLITSSLEIGFV